MNKDICGILLSRGIDFINAVDMCDDLIINRAKHNVSLYAAPRDYHLFAKDLFDDVIPKLQALFPGNAFRGMCDHSPINETLTAARAGLGIIGDNTRLINEKYGSYVFIGEVFTDADIETSAPCDPGECIHCGACAAACPAQFGETCLSEITQRKGELTRDETDMMIRTGTVWGCDVCQEVCPMNEGKAFTPIDYFRTDLIYDLDDRVLSGLDKEEFAERAFSWRGRSVPERNINVLYPE